MDIPTIITGSLTFTAGMAWKDAITSTVDKFYPFKRKEDYKARVVSAIIITIMIFIIYYVSMKIYKVLNNTYNNTKKIICDRLGYCVEVDPKLKQIENKANGESREIATDMTITQYRAN